MRAAACALAPFALCHAISLVIMLTAAVFGLDERTAMLLPLCRGGTIALEQIQVSPASRAPLRNKASPSGAMWNAPSRSRTP